MIFCTKCGRETEFYTIEEYTIKDFLNTEISYKEKTAKCINCNSSVFVDKVESANLEQKVKAYITKKKILPVEA